MKTIKMKKRIVTLMIILFGINISNAQNSQEAVTYMNEITKPFNDLKEDSWDYLKAVTRGKGVKKVEVKRQELIKNLAAASRDVKSKKSYNSKSDFKNAVVNYFDMTHTVLKEDFSKILDMEEISEQSYDAMEAYLLAKEKANDKLEEASKLMSDAQKVFAKENNITLQEGGNDKTSKKIEQASKVLNYYNTLYLVFFKSYKQEAYMMDALSRNDVNALEQTSSSLDQTATEGLKLARTKANFENDASLKLATIEILKFYKQEGSKDFPAIIDFYIKKDNFEKVQKVVESKKQKDRTQQDIDQYNEARESYNEAIAVYNKTIETTNAKRKESLKMWNKKVSKFFDSHTK